MNHTAGLVLGGFLAGTGFLFGYRVNSAHIDKKRDWAMIKGNTKLSTAALMILILISGCSAPHPTVTTILAATTIAASGPTATGMTKPTETRILTSTIKPTDTLTITQISKDTQPSMQASPGRVIITEIRNIYLPLITLIIGAVLGFLSQVLITRLQARQKVSDKVLDHYLNIRRDICRELSKLLILDYKEISQEFLKSSRDRLAEIYFENFDFLPREVLDELNCLIVCLADRRHRIYRIINGSILPLESSKLIPFIRSVSLVENNRVATLMYINHPNDIFKHVASIRCQVRCVLISINKYFRINYLNNWLYYTAKSCGLEANEEGSSSCRVKLARPWRRLQSVPQRNRHLYS